MKEAMREISRVSKNRFLLGLCLLVVGVSSQSANAGFEFKGGANAFIGTMANSSDSVKSRTMNGLGLYAFPGYGFSEFTVGALAEYSFVGQSTDPGSVGDTNLRGSGYLAGAAFAYTGSTVYAMLGYDALGVYTLSNKTSTGQSSSYSSPAGFRLSVGYRLTPMYSVDGYYSDVSYSKNTLDGTVTDIASDKLKAVRYGVGLTFHWK